MKRVLAICGLILILLASCFSEDTNQDTYEGRWCRIVGEGTNPKIDTNTFLQITKVGTNTFRVEYHNELYGVKAGELQGFEGEGTIADKYSMRVKARGENFTITYGKSSKFGRYLSLYFGTEAAEVSDGSFAKCAGIS